MSVTTPDDTLARAIADAERTDAPPLPPEVQPPAMPQDEAPPSADAEPVDERPAESELDDIDLQVAHREWHVVGDIDVTSRRGTEVVVLAHHFEKTYVQKPLSFSGMMQFTGLIGEKLSEAMSGANGMTVDGMIADSETIAVAGQAVVSQSDLSNVDSFVKGLARLASYAPTLTDELQCIWLRIPYNERPLVKEVWSRAPEDGGLSISDGSEMLNLFIDQNWNEVEAFFVEQAPQILKRVQKLRARASRLQKPSKRTAAATPRR
jgi:hypothetical protein